MSWSATEYSRGLAPLGARVRRGGIALIALLLVSVVPAHFVGTASAAPSTAAKYKIIYVNPLPDTPDWGRSGTYLRQAASRLGYTATVVGPSTLDMAAMVTDIQAAIASKPDIIMTCACQAGAFDAVEKKARQAGIIVVNIAADSSPASRNLFFGTNYQKLGRQAAKRLAAKMHGSANIGIVQTNGTTQNQVQEIQAFRSVLASHPTCISSPRSLTTVMPPLPLPRCLPCSRPIPTST